MNVSMVKHFKDQMSALRRAGVVLKEESMHVIIILLRLKKCRSLNTIRDIEV